MKGGGGGLGGLDVRRVGGDDQSEGVGKEGVVRAKGAERRGWSG